MVIEMGIQYAGNVDESAINEVRTELQFHDRRPVNGPSLRVRDRFQKTIPKHAAKFAAAWQKNYRQP